MTPSLFIIATPTLNNIKPLKQVFGWPDSHHNQRWEWLSCSSLQMTECGILERLATLSPWLIVELVPNHQWRMGIQTTTTALQWFVRDWRHHQSTAEINGLTASLHALGIDATALISYLQQLPDKATAQTLAGDLPYVLTLMGLPEVFPAWQEGVTHKQEVEQCQKNMAKHLHGCYQDVWPQIQSLQAVAIEPIQLPWSDITHLYRLAWFASDSAQPLLILKNLSKPLKWPQGTTSHHLAQSDQDVIDFDQSGQPFKMFGYLDDALDLLRPYLQVSTELELAIAPVSLLPDEALPLNPAVLQRYHGKIESAQTFTLQAVAPAISAKRLQDALKLARWAAHGGKWAFADADTARQFMLKLQQAENFYSEKAVCEQTSIWVNTADDDHRWFEQHFVARDILLDQFTDVWDLSMSKQAEKEETEAWSALRHGLLNSIQQPHTGDILFEGQSGVFRQGAPEALNPERKNRLQWATEELEPLGFSVLGDVVWEPGGDVWLRVCFQPDTLTYAAIMLAFSGTYIEFLNYLTDGRYVLSSQNPDLLEDTAFPGCRHGHPDAIPALLWQYHQQHMQEQKTPIRALKSNSLADFLVEMDQSLVRQLKQMRQGSLT